MMEWKKIKRGKTQINGDTQIKREMKLTDKWTIVREGETERETELKQTVEEDTTDRERKLSH